MIEGISEVLRFFTLNRIGLLLNLVGTVIIAYSIGKNLENAYQPGKKGRKIYLASVLHPILFKCGMALLFIGFLVQFFS